MIGGRRARMPRMIWALVIGMLLGALFTKLAIVFMPDSASREFLTTAVTASLGPLGIDLIAVSFAIGPLALSVNALTVVGILIVGFIMRSWF